MTLPGSVREAVSAAVRRLHRGAEVTAVAPVGGGCINNGARIDTSVGRRFFLKWNSSAPTGMFEAEMDGLRALGIAQGIRIPEPYEVGGGDGTADWLLMEWIQAEGATSESDERLGRGLALLHGRGGAGRFGWHVDNWIGSLPQSNREHDGWADFWRIERIEPQLRSAREGGHLMDSVMDDLLSRIPAALDGVDTPALLHGDLWSGNAYVAEGGDPVVVDPAVYLGDGEVDLAMSELFGGFGARFYDAYRETRGITEAYESHRRDLYQLYYLLVHVNLFGSGYLAASRRAARRVLAALG